MRHDPYFHIPTASVCFVVKIAGKFVTCHVTEGWMYDRLGSNRLRWGLLDGYRRSSPVIDAAAMQRWHASGGAEPVWLVRARAFESGEAPSRHNAPTQRPLAGAHAAKGAPDSVLSGR